MVSAFTKTQNNISNIVTQSNIRLNVTEMNTIKMQHMQKHISHRPELSRTVWYTIYTGSCTIPVCFQLPRIKALVTESWNAAVLDSGATNIVAGEVWDSCYIPDLTGEDKKKNQHHATANTCRFGDGKLFPALFNVNIPVWFSNQNLTLNTDIALSDMPLLLSKKSMKKADMNLDSTRNQ